MESSSETERIIGSREKLVRRVISPAIEGRSCPICLGALQPRSAAVLTPCHHAYCVGCIREWSRLRRKCPLCNGHFGSWFSEIDLPSRSFRKELLPPMTAASRSLINHDQLLPPTFLRNRSRPLPPRRSFGRPGSAGPDVIAERKLQWRASVYVRRLQAVSLAPRIRLRVSLPINDGVKERILQKIEPWIRRELQALLGDQDPSIIVYVATSLFIASLESNGDAQSDFLVPLRAFLLDRTDAFWHELRCFAESSFNMETYDTVVEYKRLQ